MKRVYVIMKEENASGLVEPYDVVSSMTEADIKCFQYEDKDSHHIYYWREIISSED